MRTVGGVLLLVLKDYPAQTLVPESAVETLDVSVLPETVRFDVNRPAPFLFQSIRRLANEGNNFYQGKSPYEMDSFLHFVGSLNSLPDAPRSSTWGPV